MKTYYCLRCGKRFQGRMDRCPRCAQRLVYARGGKYFDAMGNELVLDKEGKHATLKEPNPNAPK